jgi:hypothetical protein
VAQPQKVYLGRVLSADGSISRRRINCFRRDLRTAIIRRKAETYYGADYSRCYRNKTMFAGDARVTLRAGRGVTLMRAASTSVFSILRALEHRRINRLDVSQFQQRVAHNFQRRFVAFVAVFDKRERT